MYVGERGREVVALQCFYSGCKQKYVDRFHIYRHKRKDYLFSYTRDVVIKKDKKLTPQDLFLCYFSKNGSDDAATRNEISSFKNLEVVIAAPFEMFWFLLCQNKFKSVAFLTADIRVECFPSIKTTELRLVNVYFRDILSHIGKLFISKI